MRVNLLICVLGIPWEEGRDVGKAEDAERIRPLLNESNTFLKAEAYCRMWRFGPLCLLDFYLEDKYLDVKIISRT